MLSVFTSSLTFARIGRFLSEEHWLENSNLSMSPVSLRPVNTPTETASTSSFAGPTHGTGPIDTGSTARNGWHGLGSLNDVSLREARIKRDAARQQARAGVVQVRRSKMASEGVAAPTFNECAERYIEDNWMRWSKQHRANGPRRWSATLYLILLICRRDCQAVRPY